MTTSFVASFGFVILVVSDFIISSLQKCCPLSPLQLFQNLKLSSEVLSEVSQLFFFVAFKHIIQDLLLH